MDTALKHFLVLGLMAFGPSAVAQVVSARAAALAAPAGYEVGVSFSGPVDLASIGRLSNYILSDGSVVGLRFIPASVAAILETSGLVSGRVYTLTISNLVDNSGNDLAPLTVTFSARPFSWIGVGGRELGFAPEAVAIGDRGFDLFNGGIQFWDNYDEVTFAQEKLTGDFDRAVRVEYQDASSRWARAGLMVREALDAGRPRPADVNSAAQAFSRYVAVSVNPIMIYDGRPAANQYEVTRRLFTGGIGRSTPDPTESIPLLRDGPPAYPNAWMRIKRVGNEFSMYRSDDGIGWTLLGTTVFPAVNSVGQSVPPFPQAVFVGPAFGSENGNILAGSGARDNWLARFRDYGDPGAGADPDHPLSIERAGPSVILRWDGGFVLEQAETVGGPWKEVPGAVSPKTLPALSQTLFFRLRS